MFYEILDINPALTCQESCENVLNSHWKGYSCEISKEDKCFIVVSQCCSNVLLVNILYFMCKSSNTTVENYILHSQFYPNKSKEAKISSTYKGTPFSVSYLSYMCYILVLMLLQKQHFKVLND